jgi:hypothetical protein
MAEQRALSDSEEMRLAAATLSEARGALETVRAQVAEGQQEVKSCDTL